MCQRSSLLLLLLLLLQTLQHVMTGVYKYMTSLL